MTPRGYLVRDLDSYSFVYFRGVDTSKGNPPSRPLSLNFYVSYSIPLFTILPSTSTNSPSLSRPHRELFRQPLPTPVHPVRFSLTGHESIKFKSLLPSFPYRIILYLEFLRKIQLFSGFAPLS